MRKTFGKTGLAAASLVVASGIALTSPCYGQQDGAATIERSADVSLPRKEDSLIAMQGTENVSDDSRQQAAVGQHALPTDEFGRELNYCLLPWDYTPPQE
jgi:hypothetical protein